MKNRFNALTKRQQGTTILTISLLIIVSYVQAIKGLTTPPRKKPLTSTAKSKIQESKGIVLGYLKSDAYRTASKLEAAQIDDLNSIITKEYENYKESIEDATIAELGEVHAIVKLVPWNYKETIWDVTGQYVLMLTWVPEWVAQKIHQPKLGKENQLTKHNAQPITLDQTELNLSRDLVEVWLSPVPQLLDFMVQYVKNAGLFKNLDPQVQAMDTFKLNLRIVQYLGLLPDKPRLFDNRYFIEIWVKPEDLFRPCIDTEVSGEFASPDFTDDENLKAIPQAHRSAIKNMMKEREQAKRFTVGSKINYENKFFEEKINKTYDSEPYPWTRLGYTYDWGTTKRPHVGASEFLLRPNAKIIVRSIDNTRDYILTHNVPNTGTKKITESFRAVTVTKLLEKLP